MELHTDLENFRHLLTTAGLPADTQTCEYLRQDILGMVGSFTNSPDQCVAKFQIFQDGTPFERAEFDAIVKSVMESWVEDSANDTKPPPIDYSKDEAGSVRTLRTLEAMQIHGGGFAAKLAAAWVRADSVNHAKLLAAFPDLYAKYAAMACVPK